MPSSSRRTTAARLLTIAILAGCSAFGAYATLGTASRNGLFAALNKVAGPDVKAKSKYFPGGPAPYKTTYTGIAAVDDALLVLVAFFSVILSDANPPDVSWLSRYLMTRHAVPGGMDAHLRRGAPEGKQGPHRQLVSFCFAFI